MGEIKSVKVDNWGVFFLQKLQNFFNKTDYCDLTLQFRDNSQLKVHRLVLSACTDFFNVLEQTCELIDDALVMPIELQADVVVPIVNFMYTGTLEFELKMYNKLLNTAREMNMTVLLKLLEAHKRTMETTKTGPNRSGSPRTKKAATGSPQVAKVVSSPQTVSSTQQAQRRMLTANNPKTPRRYTTIKQMMFKEATDAIIRAGPNVHRGPTRFEAMNPNSAAEPYEPSFDSMSYESRPLKEEPEDYEELQTLPAKHRSSPFEQLRKGYHNNKRPAVTTFTSPPAKKPNIEDVKEFSEQQRMRKQIAAEYGDDAEYDGVMDDDIHNDDDDDEPSANSQSVKKQTQLQQQQQKEQQLQPQASIIIKQSPNEKPTIVVKDNSNSKMDHAKIISEVLRQYPHLVKSNKNIKLKIMPNVGGQPQKITVRKEDLEQNRAQQQLLQQQSKQPRVLTNAKQATSNKVEAQTSAAVTSVETVVAAATAGSNPASLPTPKRRIDSKTMHALIAQGAANTTGPWLCLRCGVNGRPISIPSYRGFRRHLINTHKEIIDPALCEHCGWHSSSNRVLVHHLLVEHKLPSTQYKFPKCDHCTHICIDERDLDSHIEKVHPNEQKQQCIYCNKLFFKELQLFNHMKMFHKKIAREDGVIDFSEDELADFEEELIQQATTSTVDKKIKIISDISLPSTILKLDEVSAAAVEEDYANDSGPKFVNADGNEMLLTAEQREEIMSQLDQDHDGGVVMVLNESAFPPGSESVVEETKIDSTENIDVFNEHQIYSGFATEVEGEAEFDTGHDTSAEPSALDVNKGEEQEEIEEEVAQEHEESEHEERMDEDHMEWAQNLISAHDADDDDNEDEEEHVDDEEMEAEEATTKKITAKTSSVADDDEEKVSSSKSPSDNTKAQAKDPKKEDDISLKLKMLTGDWSDDEIEEDEDDGEDDKSTSAKPETNAELAATLAPDDITEKPSSEVIPKQKETTNDSHNEKEAESTPPAADDPAVEEEISQSTQSEPAEEDENKPKENILEENLSQEDLKKSKEPILKSDTSDTATKVEDKEKETQKSSPATEETKPRRTSAKEEEAVKLEVKKEINLDETTAEDPIESTSPKKSDDDSLADAEPEKNKTKTQTDSNIDEEVEDPVTSTKDDSLKTVDKVKSLISEWADDDDDN